MNLRFTYLLTYLIDTNSTTRNAYKTPSLQADPAAGRQDGAPSHIAANNTLTYLRRENVTFTEPPNI